ncbi:hypothetical protein Pse7429DRAFT_4069 [Pseudanabaena biceps PCC 7429]|uniref:Uncharacterized protein n=1 Tax=Pseudanabaena biceps PCC 7429 TaxID=927668 RepID=L8MWL9_9CYAN|nr:hypothetical protein Pse7429DRAFT_4069 [Pseudanabaena biceps PCC 7429]
MGLIKYKTLKPAAHAQRVPQVLDLDFMPSHLGDYR